MITASAADPFAALFAPPAGGPDAIVPSMAGGAATFGTMLAAAPAATAPTPSFRGTLTAATLPIGTLMTAEPAPAAPLPPPGFTTGIAPTIVKSAAAAAMTAPAAASAPSPGAVPEGKAARPPVAVPLPGIDRPATPDTTPGPDPLDATLLPAPAPPARGPLVAAAMPAIFQPVAPVEIAPIVYIVQPAASDDGIVPVAPGPEPDATAPMAGPPRVLDQPRSASRPLPADAAPASPTPVEDEGIAKDAAPVSPVPVPPTASPALTPIVAKGETPVARAPAAPTIQAPLIAATLSPAMTDAPAPPPVSGGSRPVAARDEPAAPDTPPVEEDATVAPPLPTMMAPPLQPLVREMPVAAATIVQSGAIDPAIRAGGGDDRSEAAPAGRSTAPAPAPATTRAADPGMTDRLTPGAHTIAGAPAGGGRAVREEGVAEARAPGGAVTSLDARSFAALVEQKTASAASAPAPASPAAPVPEARIVAEPGRMGHEMGVAIARHAAEGGGEALTVRLNPAEFGRVDVTLSFDDRGTLRAAIAAESPAALDLLRRDSADLGRALTDAGMRTDAQSFRFDARQGGADAGGQGAQGGQRWQQPAGTRAATTVADDTHEPVYRPLRTQGRVDLMA